MSNHTYNQHLVCTACGIREERGEIKGYDNCPKYYTKAPTAPEPSDELRLDQLFNKTVNAQQIAVDTVQQYSDWFENSEIADQANKLLDRYCAEFKAEIRSIFAAALAKQDTQSRKEALEFAKSQVYFEPRGSKKYLRREQRLRSLLAYYKERSQLSKDPKATHYYRGYVNAINALLAIEYSAVTAVNNINKELDKLQQLAELEAERENV